MKRILFIFLVSAAMLFGACTAPATTKQPATTPTVTPVLDSSYTIKVTGERRSYNQSEHDRRNQGKQSEYKSIIAQRNAEISAENDAIFKREYAKGKDSYDAYVASGQQKKEMQAIIDNIFKKYEPMLEELDKKYPYSYEDLWEDKFDVSFSGSYMVITSSGSTASRSVDGITPAEYYIGSADIVSCSFQKSGESGKLKVEIVKGGKVVRSEYTTADYGVVSIATR